MKRAWLAIALIACGPSTQPSAPNPDPMTKPSITPDARRAHPILDARATELDAFAKQLRDQPALVALRDAVAAIQGSARWRAARQRVGDYRPLAPERVGTLLGELETLARQCGDSATALRAGQLAVAIEALRLAVDHAYAAGLGTLQTEAVEELVFVRDHVCKPPTEPTCERQPALSAGFDAAVAISKAVRATLTDAANELATLPELDAHAVVVLQRAVGKGPSYGEACGAEELCAWDQTCMAETHTCEHACSEGAMQPCPGGKRCVRDPKLPRTVCR